MREEEQLAPQADITVPAVASQVGGAIEPFLDAGRVSLSTQNASQPDVVTPGSTTTPVVPETFVTPTLPGRVALNANEPGPPNQPGAQLPSPPTTPFVPEAFENPARVTIGNELPTTTAGGFVPLTSAPQTPFLSTSGSFSGAAGARSARSARAGARLRGDAGYGRRGEHAEPLAGADARGAARRHAAAAQLAAAGAARRQPAAHQRTARGAAHLHAAAAQLAARLRHAAGATAPTATPGASTVPGVVSTPTTASPAGATVPPAAVPTTAPSGGAAPSP